ncbi:hypothetical protein ACIP4Y_21090 [Streptomyces sp. NPDC088810]|uniref:hypothetical protein n=1 Tax=Streptomyces sp. NPDC088810 TaxID=3365904 RepID=UPI003826A371
MWRTTRRLGDFVLRCSCPRSRRTGGAIGITVAGPVAGAPGDRARFLYGPYSVALGSASRYAATAVLALVLLPGTWSLRRR